jgi:hypothetical protein
MAIKWIGSRKKDGSNELKGCPACFSAARFGVTETLALAKVGKWRD